MIARHPSLPVRRALRAVAATSLVAALPLTLATAAHATDLKDIRHHCSSVDDEGEPTGDFTDPWLLDFSTQLPKTTTVGDETALDVKVSVTIGSDAVDILREKGITSIDYGMSLHFLSNSNEDFPNFADVEFSDAPVAVPASGPLTLTGTSSEASLLFESPGEVTVSLDSFVLGAGTEEDGLAAICEPEKGQSLSLGTITVTDNTAPTEPQPTTTVTTTVTQTEPDATRSPAEPTSSDLPGVSGPPVQTDDLSTGSNTTALGLIGLALAAATGGTAAAARRTHRD